MRKLNKLMISATPENQKRSVIKSFLDENCYQYTLELLETRIQKNTPDHVEINKIAKILQPEDYIYLYVKKAAESNLEESVICSLANAIHFKYRELDMDYDFSQISWPNGELLKPLFSTYCRTKIDEENGAPLWFNNTLRHAAYLGLLDIFIKKSFSTLPVGQDIKHVVKNATYDIKLNG